jgi:hypothetical protein
VLLLAGCGGGGGEAERVYNPTPIFKSFSVVDSYGVDSSLSSRPLAINPYQDDGLFDVFWWVTSTQDYQVNLYLNDRDALGGAIRVYSDVCGSNGRCGGDGNAICQYTSDFYMACNDDRKETDIASLFSQVPQQMFLLLEVCDIDSPFCTLRSLPVVME